MGDGEPMSTDGLRPCDYFDLSDPSIASLFDGAVFVWDVLAVLVERVRSIAGGPSRVAGRVMAGSVIADHDVVICEGALVEPGCYIEGPTFIATGAEVRQGAYIRGGASVAPGAVVGHTTEVKNSLFLPGAKAPHFAYVGDSVLGRNVNLGAGTKLSNLAINSTVDTETGRRRTISVWHEGTRHDSGLSKFGAIVGDGVSTGCNSVLNPGTLLGPGTMVHPNVAVTRGVYPRDSIIGG
jgi:NDP-sugar pyrophosphorylase family protein